MTDKVKELAEQIIAVIDDKEKKWPSAEMKLVLIRSYLLGLCDGYDYVVEKLKDTSAIYLKQPGETFMSGLKK